MAIAVSQVSKAAAATGAAALPARDPFTDPSYRHGNVETDLAPNFLSGEVVARIVESDGETPISIIDANESWYVDAYLRMTGALVPMICGSLCFRLIGENIGPGGDDFELTSDEGLIPLNPCGNGTYHAHFSVPANAVQVEDCGTPYELVVTAAYLTSCPLRRVESKKPGDNLRPGAMAAMVTFPTALFIYEGVEL